MIEARPPYVVTGGCDLDDAYVVGLQLELDEEMERSARDAVGILRKLRALVTFYEGGEVPVEDIAAVAEELALITTAVD